MVLNSDERCEFCVPETFKSARLAKQNAIMSYLDSINLTGTSTDITINRGECGLERPDRVFETMTFVLIFECDERQHSDRQCSCEQTRMVNIGQSFCGLPVYFIRWNPDDYQPKNDTDPEDIKKRNMLAGDFINSILTERTLLPQTNLVSVIYLYYDGWDGILNEKWEAVTKFVI